MKQIILWILLLGLTVPALAEDDFYSKSGTFFDRITCNSQDAHTMKGLTTLGVVYPNPFCAMDRFIHWSPDDPSMLAETARPFYKSVVYREEFCKNYDLSKVTFEPALFQQACSLPATYNTYRNLAQKLTDDAQSLGIVLLEDWNPTDLTAGNFSDVFFGGFEGNQPIVIASNLLLAELATKKALEASTALARAHTPSAKNIEIQAAVQMLDFYRYEPIMAVNHAFSQLHCENIKGPSKACFVYRDMLKIALTKTVGDFQSKYSEVFTRFREVNEHVTASVESLNTNENVRRIFLVKQAMDALAKLHNTKGFGLSRTHPEVEDLYQSLAALQEIGIDYQIEGQTSFDSDEAMTYRALSRFFAMQYLELNLNTFEYHDKKHAELEFSIWKNSWQYEVFQESMHSSLEASMSFITEMFNDFGNKN